MKRDQKQNVMCIFTYPSQFVESELEPSLDLCKLLAYYRTARARWIMNEPKHLRVMDTLNLCTRTTHTPWYKYYVPSSFTSPFSHSDHPFIGQTGARHAFLFSTYINMRIPILCMLIYVQSTSTSTSIPYLYYIYIHTSTYDGVQCTFTYEYNGINTFIMSMSTVFSRVSFVGFLSSSLFFSLSSFRQSGSTNTAVLGRYPKKKTNKGFPSDNERETSTSIDDKSYEWRWEIHRLSCPSSTLHSFWLFYIGT